MELTSINRVYSILIATAVTIAVLSVFLFARAGVSIGVIVVMALYLFSGKFSFKDLRQNRSLFYLFLAGIIINIQMIYVMVINQEFMAKSLFGFSNPILVVIYILALIHFLSRNIKVRNWLINFFIIVVSVFVIVSLIAYVYRYMHDAGFIISDFYKGVRGGSVMQSVVAISLPIVSIMLLIKVGCLKNIISKILLVSLVITIVFVDLFANRSKAGYLIEFAAFIYFALFLVRRYAHQNNYSFRRLLYMIMVTVLVILTLLVGTYRYSSVFNDRTTETYKEMTVFFDSHNNKQVVAEDLGLASTQLRLLYYYSSIKVLQKYPTVFVFGCGYGTNKLDVKECTSQLIERSDELRANNSVLNGGIMPHDEFLSYVFRGGIIAGAMLLMFFVMLFYEAKYLSQDTRACLRILAISFFIGCAFDYFITVQMTVFIFATLLGIFLSERKFEGCGASNKAMSK
ncbi:O-antigen ligase family protein [Francisella adeliensis]|uniref:O-antigen ligase-related domain-containing protein n=1 Tax=Francisella adeliensis TaxID=2007306 RepID=A0A2Z4XVV3_9GAMM|nr:O-antigen ligase family protein [Francisella adeliensis]AXA32961.1 hypothetical protein CDH04_00370 [Francisella adeliensis]MBK2086155.1 O-antigen ligase family protein [Francisella adeliensis]MBK2096681.1 O-antigen ligase family protein [Francisella adeliensis]QIW11188.1 hypothetical protein FZC43_00370 [Francisella adeliensis]QIW13064.1 hypothetical protein FZC44_00370 [Francisella adeliensis]